MQSGADSWRSLGSAKGIQYRQVGDGLVVVDVPRGQSVTTCETDAGDLRLSKAHRPARCLRGDHHARRRRRGLHVVDQDRLPERGDLALPALFELPATLAARKGAGQGLNPAVNRPIVMSVVEPQLRGQAFAIFLSVFQTIGWALFSYGAGMLAVQIGIQASFNIFLVWLMLINAAFLGLLFLCYRKDVLKVRSAMLALVPGRGAVDAA